MSPGSEPERDDTGLPPVDIEIPDDARELDLDVHAYHRELRALRRQERRNRWHRSVGKDGIILPLIACCLILALIAGTLLTVFSTTADQGLGLPGSATNTALSTGHGASSASPAGEPTPHIVAASLPPLADITVHGRGIPVGTLHKAMLVLVPQRCDCRGTLAWLADLAASARATAYVVYNQRTSAEVRRLYGQLDARQQRALILAADTASVLTSPTSYPAGIPATQLTAVLVARDGGVRYATRLSPADSDTQLVRAITG